VGIRSSLVAGKSRLSVICMVALLAAVGLLSAQPAEELSGSLNGAQVASGWGPMRPTAKPKATQVIPFNVTYEPVRLKVAARTDADRLFSSLTVYSKGSKRVTSLRRQLHLEMNLERSMPGERVLVLEPHPMLAQLLSGVEFFVPDEAMMPRIGQLLAARDGKAYELPRQFNYLLRDCGWKFTADEIPNWARLLCIIRIAGRDGLVILPDLESDSSAPFIPRISFQSVAVETIGVRERAVLVRFVVDGKADEMQLPIWTPRWGKPRGWRGDTLHYYPNESDLDRLSEATTDGEASLALSGTAVQWEAETWSYYATVRHGSTPGLGCDIVFEATALPDRNGEYRVQVWDCLRNGLYTLGKN